MNNETDLKRAIIPAVQHQHHHHHLKAQILALPSFKNNHVNSQCERWKSGHYCCCFGLIRFSIPRPRASRAAGGREVMHPSNARKQGGCDTFNMYLYKRIPLPWTRAFVVYNAHHHPVPPAAEAWGENLDSFDVLQEQFYSLLPLLLLIIKSVCVVREVVCPEWINSIKRLVFMTYPKLYNTLSLYLLHHKGEKPPNVKETSFVRQIMGRFSLSMAPNRVSSDP